jgi:hypothetical protein
MEQSGFDDLAKALSNGSGSRRRALQMVGAALVGAPLIAAFPVSAAGSGKKRCKKKHGVYLSSGECNCGVAWHKGRRSQFFPCSDNAECACYKTVAGSGFCADWSKPVPVQGCESDADCASHPGTSCTVDPGYSKGKSCGPEKPCAVANEGCINGTCQYTACRPPCS